MGMLYEYDEVSRKIIEGHQMNKLPYDFDLLHDIKTMDEVEAIARGEPHNTSASLQDIVDTFISLDMEVPECLSTITPTHDIWVCNDGTWISYEPPIEEMHKYRKTRIMKFE